MNMGKGEFRTLNHIKSNTAQFCEANVDVMEALDGECDACGQYDTELVPHGTNAFCRQRDCEAVRAYVDTKLGHRIEAGGKTVIITTPEALELAVPMYKEAFDDIKSGKGLV